MEGVLFKIKVDLEARNLEVLVLPPEGTWRNDSQPEIDCFADCQKGSRKIFGQDQDGKKKSNQLFNRSIEVNGLVYSSLITCLCNHMAVMY